MVRATFIMPRFTSESEARRMVEACGGTLDRYEAVQTGWKAETLFADPPQVYVLAMDLSYPPAYVEPEPAH